MLTCLGTVGVLLLIGLVGVLALSLVAAVRNPKPPQVSDAEAREMLANADLGQPPRALRGAPPRPDVFSGEGYLSQRRYRQLYLPLLLHGRVYRGLCIRYWEMDDGDDVDVEYEYAWVDDTGRLRRVKGATSYDRIHTAHSRGAKYAEMFPVWDANMALGQRFTVVCAPDGDDHVLYEALGIGYGV